MKLSRNSLVAIDTQILIYAFRKKYDTEQQKIHSSQAKSLFRTLQKQRVRLCISAITVAEYLAGVPYENHAELLKQLASTFEIAIFNLQAAAIASRLVKPSKTLVQGDRQVLIADTKIIGSIVAYKCSVFFTNDEKLKKLAENLIAIGELDPQLELNIEFE